MAENTSGSCLCNSIKYVINEEINSVVNCHCKTCKKITGGAFETIAIVGEKSIDVIAGQELLNTFRINENADKNFCSICGTPIYNQVDRYPGFSMVHIGSLDQPFLVAPVKNIFCESMLPWVKGIADLECFEQLPTK